MSANKYWFRPKKYGYGAEPSCLEGWISILVFAVLFIGILMISAYNEYEYLFILNLALVIAFVYFTKVHTKGKWKWRWG